MPKRSCYLLAIFFIFTQLLTACDPQRMSKCEWYFTPHPEGKNLVEIGWVSVCASNFKLGRQRCFFTAKPNFLEKMNGVPFKYDSLEYTNTLPKKITSVRPCKKGS